MQDVAFMSGERLQYFVAVMVAVVWAAAGLASVITQQYKTLEIVTPVMMIVTGFLFGFQVQVKRARQREEQNGTKE